VYDTQIFIDLTRRAPYLAWQLAPTMCTAAQGDAAANAFRRREAFDFLVTLARHEKTGGNTAGAILPAMFRACARTLDESAACLRAGKPLVMSMKRLRSVFQLATSLLAHHGDHSEAGSLRVALEGLRDTSQEHCSNKQTKRALVGNCTRVLAVGSKKKGKKQNNKKSGDKKAKTKATKAKSAKKRKRSDKAAAAESDAATPEAVATNGSSAKQGKKKKRRRKKSQAK